jgi:hypothetical protein
MHFPDCGRHLRDRVDILDHETMRQKSLIDQLHDPFICRVKPDRPEMLSAYLHVSVCVVVTLTNNLNATRFPITNPAVGSADSPRHGEFVSLRRPDAANNRKPILGQPTVRRFQRSLSFKPAIFISARNNPIFSGYHEPESRCALAGLPS